MFQRFKRALCRLLGIKTRPYLTPSPLPKGPIIEPLTPSTLIHRRHEGISPHLYTKADNPHLRSDPVYQDTWTDPFRQQRPKRVDPRPRPLLRAVTRDDDPPATVQVPTPAPGASVIELIFAETVMRDVLSSRVPEPELAPAPAPAPSYNSDYGCARDYTPDASSPDRTED